MPGSKFKLLPGIIVPNRKNAICQFWSNRAYTFESGYEDEQRTYNKVQIDDRDFLERVRDGEYRLNSGDLMRVDMTIKEVINLRTQKVRTAACHITKVRDYRPMKRCEQLTFADFVDGENND